MLMQGVSLPMIMDRLKEHFGVLILFVLVIFLLGAMWLFRNASQVEVILCAQLGNACGAIFALTTGTSKPTQQGTITNTDSKIGT